MTFRAIEINLPFRLTPCASIELDSHKATALGPSNMARYPGQEALGNMMGTRGVILKQNNRALLGSTPDDPHVRFDCIFPSLLFHYLEKGFIHLQVGPSFDLVKQQSFKAVQLFADPLTPTTHGFPTKLNALTPQLCLTL